MHALELAGIGELGEVAADGLYRDVEPFREVLDHDLALAARDLEDVGLAKRLGHGRTSLTDPASMFVLARRASVPILASLAHPRYGMAAFASVARAKRKETNISS